MHSHVAKLTVNVKTNVRSAIPHIKPLLDERKAKIIENGVGENWPGKPVGTPLPISVSQRSLLI